MLYLDKNWYQFPLEARIFVGHYQPHYISQPQASAISPLVSASSQFSPRPPERALADGLLVVSCLLVVLLARSLSVWAALQSSQRQPAIYEDSLFVHLTDNGSP